MDFFCTPKSVVEIHALAAAWTPKNNPPKIHHEIHLKFTTKFTRNSHRNSPEIHHEIHHQKITKKIMKKSTNTSSRNAPSICIQNQRKHYELHQVFRIKLIKSSQQIQIVTQHCVNPYLSSTTPKCTNYKASKIEICFFVTFSFSFFHQKFTLGLGEP